MTRAAACPALLLLGLLLLGLRLLPLGLLLLLGLGLLLTRLGLLPVLLRLLLLAALRRAFLFHQLREILQLGDDPHTAFLIAGLGQCARALDHLLDVLLALRIHLRLGQLLLDLIESLRAPLLLCERGRARQ